MLSATHRAVRLLRTTLCWLLTLIFVATPGIAWAGASVSVQRGFFAYDTTDLQISGAYPLTVVRHYQSAKSDGSPVTAGPFGLGTHMGIYSLRATFNPSTNQVRVYMPTGEQTYFNFNSSLGKYTNASRADGLRGKATVSVSGTTTFITLELENGTKLFFDNSSGVNKLTSIKDRFAQSIRFVYENFSGG